VCGRFGEFVDAVPSPILVAHNGRRFDVPFLSAAAGICAAHACACGIPCEIVSHTRWYQTAQRTCAAALRTHEEMRRAVLPMPAAWRFIDSLQARSKSNMPHGMPCRYHAVYRIRSTGAYYSRPVLQRCTSLTFGDAL
jgi:hypothetical protein